ncbi:MAG: PrsW family glutamic-type intramembrane protease [Candidatus Peregrinibacteria bacterium]
MPAVLLWTLAFLCSVLPALGWLLIWRLNDEKEAEPKKMVLLAFLFGILSVLPFFLARHFWGEQLQGIGGWGAIILFAVAEEFVKAFALIRLGKYLRIEFTQMVDGIVYATALGLGFAFAENILYFSLSLSSFGVTKAFWAVVVFRSLGTMLAHSLFSGIFGFFWGYAFVSKNITPHHQYSVVRFWKVLHESLRFHIIFSHILQARPSLHGHEKLDLLREAFRLVVILHIFFNAALQFSFLWHPLTVLIVPLLMGGFFFLSQRFLQKRNIDIFHPL